MKTDALRSLRRKLAAGTPVFGLWVTLESPSITEMAVALGVDWIVVDAEHGHLDWKEIVEHVRAAVRSQTVVLVRVAERSIGLIKRALDIGADGIVVPWIESAEQLREIVSYARFPPEGVRGIGAERATCWGQCLEQHTQEANDHVLVVPVVESVAGGRAIDSMLQVEGVELFFFGPSDYSSSAGYRGQWEGPGVAGQLLAIKDKILAAGKHVGIIATSNENLQERIQQGFRMVCVGIDSGLLLRSLHGALATAGRDRRIVPSFAPEGDTVGSRGRPASGSLSPRSLGGDHAGGRGSGCRDRARRDALSAWPASRRGAQPDDRSRHLRAGSATGIPSASVHRVGDAAVRVAGRGSGGTALCSDRTGQHHDSAQPGPRRRERVVCAGGGRARGHAGGDAQPHAGGQVLLATRDARGLAGQRRSGTRHASAHGPRFAAGQGAGFIDYFNRDLVPGIEMSGGYGLFQPGGRLLAHFHDFDESICIVQGLATCIVEGRKYTLSNGATALQPRGRVHYFINQTQEPMAMIWVYGGPVPERLVVAEHNCTVEGNPWKSR